MIPHIYNQNIVVAVSGKGRLLESLFESMLRFHYSICGVIVSNDHCGAIEVAKSHRVPIFFGDYSEKGLAATTEKQKIFLKDCAPGLIVLAGFLKKFPVGAGVGERDILTINIHPALLPKYGGPGFYGMKVHEAVWSAKESHSGATVHMVNDKYDEGRIVAQAQVPLETSDTPQDIARKVFEIEKQLLPQVIEKILAGTLDDTKLRDRNEMDQTTIYLKSHFEGAWLKMMGELYKGPESLLQAVHYSCDGPGKRVRPLLLLLAARALGARLESCTSAAIAVEMIHDYSLVHDDLPSMDDDDFRRGRPTTHKVFSEATAILAGDALLTDSFLVIARDTVLSDSQKVGLMSELAKAGGSQGMVLGQGLDMEASSSSGLKTSEELDRIHSLKTGALLGASLAMAALCAGRADLSQKMRTAGTHIGLAFQIMDDLLDGAKGTGKSAGKDKAQNKLTYLSFYSRDEALHLANRWTNEGKAILKDLGMVSELMGYIDLLLKREY